MLGNENFTFVIDPLHDRRNGYYLFQTTPLGALRDMTVTDDQQNSAWNGIWQVKTGRFEHGLMLEVAIPFKTETVRGLVVDDGSRRGGAVQRRCVLDRLRACGGEPAAACSVRVRRRDLDRRVSRSARDNRLARLADEQLRYLHLRVFVGVTPNMPVAEGVGRHAAPQCPRLRRPCPLPSPHRLGGSELRHERRTREQ